MAINPQVEFTARKGLDHIGQRIEALHDQEAAAKKIEGSNGVVKSTKLSLHG